MKILILGAGAVGGYFGGRLHQAGADVTFLLREPRATKVKAEGLVIKSPKGDAVLPVKVVTKGSEGGPYDIVILASKAYDLDSAIEAIAPAVGEHTTIVPMLNGLAHLDVLDNKFGADKVAGGLARIGGMLGPNGEVLHTSPFAGVSFGERSGKPVRASLGELDALCKKAGIEGGLNDKINQDLWDKWIMLTSLASMCCTLRGTTGDILSADDGEALMLETVDECRRVARAEGFDPGDKGIENLKVYLTKRGSAFAASMLGDLEKGGAIEGRHVIGDMLSRARKHGIAAPNLRMAYAVVQAYEARRARGGLSKPTK
ncbi:2-dehydropantoate 2-reductase [Enhydrobacter aerosaccus]|uniref:2-dehydropantoate 2-reductase n=1 Tax=Enhydrobacter aerosaccus TaxID=225324 RepID=A0A1T4QSW6_9HYPH|nr:2-dehydropantoate 2-reductase [Enhydrobacter aerosaccus]SKA06810.1 2-dehydropantoate 2-reductase [Enhydrobacter aerosaccus]